MVGDVGAQVDFGEVAEKGRGGEAAERDAFHIERDDAEPCGAAPCVEFEVGGQERAERGGLDFPVEEGEVVPFLAHDPVGFRQGPRAVSGVEEGGVGSH